MTPSEGRMNWTSVPFSFDGRINRGRFWCVIVFVMVAMLAFGGMVVAVGSFGNGPKSFSVNVYDVFALVDPAWYKSLPRLNIPFAVFHLAATLLVLWIYLAACVKRLHDRGRSGWWMLLYFAVPGLYNRFAGWLPDSDVTTAIGVGVMLLVIWNVIELGFLRGTAGTNPYGQNPLSLAPLPERQPAASGWDQRSALEIGTRGRQ